VVLVLLCFGDGDGGEDRVYDPGTLDRADDAKAATAGRARTPQHVDLPHPGEQVGPSHTSRSLRCAGAACALGAGWCRDDPSAESVVGCEDAVEAQGVSPAWREQRSESREERHRVEVQCADTIGSRSLQPELDPAVREPPHPAVGDRGAGDVAGEPFEAGSVAGGDADCGVQVEAGGGPCAQTGGRLGTGLPAGGGALGQPRHSDGLHARALEQELGGLWRVGLPALVDETKDAGLHLGDDLEDVGVLGKPDPVEADIAAVVLVEHPVGSDEVRVGEELGGVGVALDLEDTARVRCGDALGARLDALPVTDNPGEDAEDLATQGGVVGDPPGQRPGQRQDPLAVRHLARQHAICEVGGLLVHPPSRTGWAKPRFAGERNDPRSATGAALETKKSRREVTARDDGTELPLDDGGEDPLRVRPLAALDEVVEVLPEDLNEVGGLALPWEVGGGAGHDGSPSAATDRALLWIQ
jgi:hypothetical protein